MPKQYKLKFKPTPISRLRKWNIPIPMKGDPEWCIKSHYFATQFDTTKEYWKAREEAVYYAMCPSAAWRRDIDQMVEDGAAEYEKIMEEREKWKPTS
jgi:hypothetical protein